MKIKRSIFATVSGGKINSGGAQSAGVAPPAPMPAHGENDSSPGAPIERAGGDIPADAFYERLILRSATIDELLSDDFEPLDGKYGDTELASRRLTAWRRASAGGGSDLALFERRL